MATNRRITSWPKIFFHAGTGRANARAPKHRLADPKGSIAQPEEIDPAHHKISTKGLRADLFLVCERRNDQKMLPLNKAYCSLARLHPMIPLNIGTSDGNR